MRQITVAQPMMLPIAFARTIFLAISPLAAVVPVAALKNDHGVWVVYGMLEARQPL